ncbi:helix-turn-helix domain-containing protein [Streptomyces syringium]|uniref:helix-turn-helix domain-containing protein n=1 Tax=Streptomyces syringium TaxID=76729 RepID=UPI003453DD28
MNQCQFCQMSLGAGGETKVGRPQKYCSTSCRQAAYRMRKTGKPTSQALHTEHTRATAPAVSAQAASRPSLRRTLHRPHQPPATIASDADEVLIEITKDIVEEARHLLRSLTTPSAEEPLRRAVQTRDHLDSLIAGLVGRARHWHLTWSRISRLLRISEDTARHRYTDAYILRRLRQHMRMRTEPPSLSALYGQAPPAEEPATPPTQPVDTPLPDQTPATPGYNRLAPVLSMLARASKMPLQQISIRAGCSASYLSRILSGERTPSWPLAERFALACQADPAVLRQLWESEQLRSKTTTTAPIVAPADLPGDDDRVWGATRLKSALHTLHVRAGQPTDYDIAVASRWRLNPDQVRALLEAAETHEWADLKALLHVLGGRIDYFKPLWKSATRPPSRPEPHLPPADPTRPLLPGHRLTPAHLAAVRPVNPPPATAPRHEAHPKAAGRHLAKNQPVSDGEELLEGWRRREQAVASRPVPR